MAFFLVGSGQWAVGVTYEIGRVAAGLSLAGPFKARKVSGSKSPSRQRWLNSLSPTSKVDGNKKQRGLYLAA
jgi:hypothetical protein